MVLDMSGASVVGDEWEREPPYLHIYVCAAVFRCGKGCEYLCALHLELGAGWAWGADGEAVGEDRAWQ